MKKLIDADALYEQIAKKEKLAQQRVLDTPSRMPNGDLNPSAIRYFTQLDERTQMKFMIADAPTIYIEPHWIPCSERLPEYFETVITWDGHCYSVEKRIPFIRDEDGNPIKGEWWVSDDYEEETKYYPNLRDGAAIAWMPLPKPYEVEE